MKRKTTEQFIKEARLVHGDKYDYSLVEYKTAKDKVTIICPLHGEFKQTPSHHLLLRKCPKCAKIQRVYKRRMSQEEFIERANNKHNNKFDYSLTKYVNMNTPIKIICPEHGEYEQYPGNHLKYNQGCLKCSYGNRPYTITQNVRDKSIGGWNIKDWKSAAEKSKNFHSYKLYVIKCYNNKETFYKIGRTYTAINKRFHGLPYNYTIIYTISNKDPRIIFNKEIELHRKLKQYKYKPLKSFKGSTECFTKY